MALEHVMLQTEQICIAAVTQCGLALEFVNKQTACICEAAVAQDLSALLFVGELTPEICLTGVKQDFAAFSYFDLDFLPECDAKFELQQLQILAILSTKEIAYDAKR
jgi:hypothetical protein